MASGDLQFLRQTDCRSQTKRHKDGNLPSGVQWRMKKGCGKSLASELWVFFNALTLLTKWHVGHLAHKNQCHFSPKILFQKKRSSVACPTTKCCHVNDTSPEYVDTGLSPGWLDHDVDWLYITINSPQPAGTWASVQEVFTNGWVVGEMPQWPNVNPV